MESGGRHRETGDCFNCLIEEKYELERDEEVARREDNGDIELQVRYRIFVRIRASVWLMKFGSGGNEVVGIIDEVCKRQNAR